jgi:quercetin dioxygenase-like cupin family protein
MSKVSPIFADFSLITPVACPCGQARRGLLDESNESCSVHRVTISANARTHYHKVHTEVYYFLEGEGHLELDGKLHTVRPGMVILIPPGKRHRAIVDAGQTMEIINFVMPPFDEADEWFD